MAKTKTTRAPAKRRARVDKPSRMKADRVVPAKPRQAPAAPDTQDDLLRQIGALLDQVDAKMAARTGQLYFGRWSDTLRAETDLVTNLSRRLDKLLNPSGRLTNPGSPEAIRLSFGAAPGTVPSWARPGTFLVWVGYVPCRCVWGGFADPAADVLAADPREVWLAPSGAVSVPGTIYPGQADVAEVFRAGLLRKTTELTWDHRRRGQASREAVPAFRLQRLASVASQAAERELARPGGAWLADALKRGPVDPVPLPPHLAAVQLSWIG